MLICCILIVPPTFIYTSLVQLPDSLYINRGREIDHIVLRCCSFGKDPTIVPPRIAGEGNQH